MMDVSDVSVYCGHSGVGLYCMVWGGIVELSAPLVSVIFCGVQS